MKRKLLLFFMVIVTLGVFITSLLFYKSSRNILIDNQINNLRTEARLAEDYINYYVTEQGDFDTVARRLKEKTNKRVTIINADGRVIGESDAPGATLDNHLNRVEVRDALEYGEGTSIRYSETEGKNMFYYAKKYEANNKVYIIRLSLEINYIEKLQRKSLSLLFISVIIGIVIATLIAYFYLDIFIMPIKDFTRFATTIAQGQYEKRINIGSKDEIGELGHAFNLMAARLEETITDLSDKSNKLVSILTSMKDGVIVVDENEKILIINPAACMLFGTAEDATGKHFLEVIRNNEIEELIKSIPDEEVEITIGYPVVRQLRIKSTRVINYNNKNGNLGVMLVIQDVTKIKRLEKMRSDFVANVSHELKTPLTSIKGFSETLMYVDDKFTRDKFLNIINIEAERLTRLINDILSLSELENKEISIRTERINIKKSIEEVVHIMQPLAIAKNIELQYKIPAGDIFILGDRDKFKQMMINLVDNAIKYTPHDGKVGINLKNSANTAEIAIIDSGAGIPREHLPRLFERFYRADKARSRYHGGTGLGLAIVKHIVMLLNGSIDVTSTVGEGTTFKITLPAVK